MNLRRIMPTTWLLLAMVLMAVLHFTVPATILLTVPWTLSGLLPLAVGFFINMLADRAFHQAQTTVKPFQESNALLTDGVFRFTRNPMYLGFASYLR